MVLEDIIEKLSKMEGDLPVYFSNGKVPTEFDSWRGKYNELTLCPEYGDAPSVTQLLVLAQQAIGKTFQGYKGGEFTMNPYTPVWADAYGSCNYDVIIGIEEREDQVVLVVINISEYA